MNERQLIPKIPLLKRGLKIIGVIVVAFMVLFGTVTWIVFQNRNELLLDQLRTFLDRSQSGELEIAALDLRLFRNFPDITVEFDSVNYWEDRDSLRPVTALPILHANKLYVALNFWSLVTGKVEVSEISLHDGMLHLVEYKGGGLNLDRALAQPGKAVPGPKKPVVKKPASETPVDKPAPKPKPKEIPQPAEAMKIALEAVDLHNLRLTWQSYHYPITNSLLIKDFDVTVTQSDDVIAATVVSSYTIEDIRFNKTQIPSGDVSLDARVRYEQKKWPSGHRRNIIIIG